MKIRWSTTLHHELRVFFISRVIKIPWSNTVVCGFAVEQIKDMLALAKKAYPKMFERVPYGVVSSMDEIIDTDIANVPGSTANTAVPAEFVDLVGRGTIH